MTTVEPEIYDSANPPGVSRLRFSPDSSTYFGRFLEFARAIDLKQLVKENDVDLLIVGPGCLPVGYPYELYEVIAYLEGNGRTVKKLSILDIDATMPDRVRAIHSFRVAEWDIKSFGVQENATQNWNDYLRYTPDTNKGRKDEEIWDRHWANIPSSLERRIESGDIDLVVADITEPGFTADSTFDLVVCRHAIYQFTYEGARLAAANLAGCMRPGALLLTGSHIQDTVKRDYPEFIQRGLGEIDLRKFGLRFNDSPDILEAYRQMVLIKE